VTLPVIRLSRASFDSLLFAEVHNRLDEARTTLVPAIKSLRGCLHFWAGVDAVSNTMINVSVWATLEDAKQMDTLAPMLALGTQFTKLGVKFERPIVNYGSLWEI
jgi:hypothetical protein